MEFHELYFERDVKWYDWLLANHNNYKAVYLVFYKLETKIPTMRWEKAVKVALCFGWIDATIKSLGGGKRIQYFTHRNPKSTWSSLNKKYIIELEEACLIQESGWKMINLAKKQSLGQHWTMLKMASYQITSKKHMIKTRKLLKTITTSPKATEKLPIMSK
jgi:uncharacterized protein YdeI (YjbR/CyaY-like superfamily)